MPTDNLDEATETERELRHKIYTLRQTLERQDRAMQELSAEAEELRKSRNGLTADALAAISGDGIATPERGYLAEPHVLAGDIRRLLEEYHEEKRKRIWYEAEYQAVYNAVGTFGEVLGHQRVASPLSASTLMAQYIAEVVTLKALGEAQ